MKCDKCRAAWETNTENGYDGGCYLEGFIKESDKIEYTNDGCTIHYKTVKKLIDEQEQAHNDYCTSVGEWYAAREKVQETCVICGGTFRGTDTATCDSNHNTVSVPCGQIICYQCWNKQRERAIYNNIEPDCCTKSRELKPQ